MLTRLDRTFINFNSSSPDCLPNVESSCHSIEYCSLGLNSGHQKHSELNEGFSDGWEGREDSQKNFKIMIQNKYIYSLYITRLS